MGNSSLLSYTTAVDGEGAVAIISAVARPGADSYLIFLTNDNACALSDALGSDSPSILDIVNATPDQTWRQCTGLQADELLERLDAAAGLQPGGPDAVMHDYDVVRLKPDPTRVDSRLFSFTEPGMDPILVEVPSNIRSIPIAHFGDRPC